MPVYDYGEEENQPYLVMRYMPAGSLRERLRNGPLSFEDARVIVARLAPALDKAHRAGVIHRDLKPENILFDDEGDAFIGDFGIAKLAETSQSLSGSMVFGTPAYMSPEQALGKNALTGSSDQYALGIVLFEMLTGRMPFKADTPMGLAMAHVNEPPPSIHSFQRDLPSGLEKVINRSLHKEPGKRFSTVRGFADALSGLRKTSSVKTGKNVKSKTSTRSGYSASGETRGAQKD